MPKKTARFFIISIIHFILIVFIYLQASTEFEELIANLKISKDPEPLTEPKNQSGEPLSPQSFAMVCNPWFSYLQHKRVKKVWLFRCLNVFIFMFEQKGTLVLKEMLKIASSGPSSSAPDFTGGQDSANPNAQQQSKRRSSKKLGTALCPIRTRISLVRFQAVELYLLDR